MDEEKQLEQFGEALEDLFDSPDTYPDRVTYLALDEEEEKQLLTPKRIQLIKTIREKEGLSVSQIADEVGRDKGAVSRDLKVLGNHNIVSLKRSGHRKEAAMAVSHIIIPLGKAGKQVMKKGT